MKLNLDVDTFLSEYWQQKPLLIREAIKDFTPPIDADELAGLAMEDCVESRIIETLPDTWQLHHGPFNEADFDRKRPWTLLVQAVDHYVQEVADLLKRVDFLPNWRIDDVMVSYAVDGGSVGPHYDNYDVFLLQGEGTRRWQLGQLCDSGSSLLPHPDLRILDSFQCTQGYVLEPGDILYVPPGVAHWGIAQGECTTFSLGFRAPRINDMLSRWVDELLEDFDSEKFYTDSKQSRVTHAGEIRSEDMSRVQEQLAAALQKKSSQHWFGELVTEPRYVPELCEQEIEAEKIALHQSDATAVLLPAAKLAWQNNDDGIDVYANGQCLQLSPAVRPTIIELCTSGKLKGKALNQAKADPETLEMLQQLISMACISIK
jgi:50S ribosomal protein L16 3-hydroxylase